MASRCAQCNKSAYPLESLNVLNKTFHKRCFQCSVCKKTLTLGGFDSYNQILYCRTHKPVPQARGLGISFQKNNNVTPQNTNIDQILERRDQEQLTAMFAPGGLDPNGSDFWTGKAFLRIILDSNLPWAMKILLDAGADPNKRLTYSGTILHIITSTTMSIRETDPLLLQILLEHGADPHLLGSVVSNTSTEQTPLQMYFSNHRFDPTSDKYTVTITTTNNTIIKPDPHPLLPILLKNHQPNKSNGPWERVTRQTVLCDLLHIARSPGEIDALVEAGADVLKLNTRSLTPLHSVATRGILPVLHRLLDLGAEPFAADRRGSTPLHTLAVSSSPDIYANMDSLENFVERCSRMGSLNVRDDRGRTPLFLAVDERLIGILCKFGADVNLLCDTDTALTKAVRRSNSKLVSALIKNAADLHLKDNTGNSPLHIACSVSNPDSNIIRSLIQAGADLWLKNSKDLIPSDTMDHVRYPTASAVIMKAERMSMAKDSRKIYEEVRNLEDSLLFRFPKGIFERCIWFACEGQMDQVL